MHPARILIVEDELAEVKMYKLCLERAGHQTLVAKTLASARELAATAEFEAALLDLRLPDGTTLDWIKELRASHPLAAIIMITGSGDIPTAVAAIKYGADNFLTKPIDTEELMVLLEKNLEMAHLRRRSDVERQLHEREHNNLFGSSPGMQEVLKQAAIAAGADTTVILYGDTGTGKGVLAHHIHEKSNRALEPFVELNCSTLKGDLLRSELFGHIKGAFTGSASERTGLIEAADGGTLFLDEIGEMDLGVQAQLLKVLEEKTFRRIGENRVRTSDFRLMCATNRDLLEAVNKGSFRHDLYYRINVFPITSPSLRERIQDIPALAHYFLQRLGYLLPLEIDVLDMLKAMPWPGNIRELRNTLERAKLLARGNPIRCEHLGDSSSPGGSAAAAPKWNLEEIEIAVVQKALNHFKEKTRTASELGISISSLYRWVDKIKELGEKKVAG